MQINKTLSAYQLVPLVFMQDNLAASQTDVQLYVTEVASAAGIAITGYTMPFAGEIVGISYDLSAAAANGTLTIGPTVGGTEKTDPTLSITTGVTGSDTCNRGKAAFAKNAIIGAEITTSAGWDGTTSDLVVIVWVILKVSGI
jgi:hypothetical protein